MLLRQIALLPACIVFTPVVIVAGCSFDVPKDMKPPSIAIDLQRADGKTFMHKAWDDLFNGGIRVMSLPPTGPTSLADFVCFAADIAGSGIPADSGNQINNCTVQSGIAVGFIPNPVAPGNTVSATVPAGPARTIYAFGIWPFADACGGPSGGSGSSGGGYLLGSVTQDIFADAAITVPVSYTAGTAPAVTCTYGSSGGEGCTSPTFPSSAVPSGGTIGTIIVINAVGTYNGSTVTIGGSNCSAISAVDGTHFSCTVPAGTGSQAIVVTDPCGRTAGVGNFGYANADFLSVGDSNPSGTALEADGTSYNFGQTSSSLTHTFTVLNSGASTTSNVLSTSITSGSANFGIGVDNCSGSTLASGSTCTVQLTFAPSSGPGSYSGTFQVTSTGGTTGTRQLSGTE